MKGRKKKSKKYPQAEEGSNLLNEEDMLWGSVAKPRHKKTDFSKITDFSVVENNAAGVAEIQKLVREAGKAAASEAKAVGIPKVFARDNKIIRQSVDGSELVIVLEGKSELIYFRHLKAGILHARKK